MTNQEIIDYTKRCIEFVKGLKYVLAHPDSEKLKQLYQVDTSSFTKPMSRELTHKINAFMFCGECLSYRIKLDDPDIAQFHTNWNWIHEIVDSIKNTTNPKEHCDTTFSTLRREIQTHLGRSNKEAVVNAINNFLIWYEQNKN